MNCLKIFISPQCHSRPTFCHSREGGDPCGLPTEVLEQKWIPAFAGMTRKSAGMTGKSAGIKCDFFKNQQGF